MAFSTTKFPVPAWKLMPSFKPAKVIVTGEKYRNGFPTNKNYWLSAEDLFHTKAEAVAAGKARLDEQQALVDKLQAAVTKKRAELAEATP